MKYFQKTSWSEKSSNLNWSERGGTITQPTIPPNLIHLLIEHTGHHELFVQKIPHFIKRNNDFRVSAKHISADSLQ